VVQTAKDGNNLDAALGLGPWWLQMRSGPITATTGDIMEVARFVVWLTALAVPSAFPIRSSADGGHPHSDQHDEGVHVESRRCAGQNAESAQPEGLLDRSWSEAPEAQR
jgi:hypothetical protein